jgi:hypothetical protein
MINANLDDDGACGEGALRFDGAERGLYDSYRSRVGVSMLAGFFLAGIDHGRAVRFGVAAGLSEPSSAPQYLKVVTMLYPHVTAALDEDIAAAYTKIRELGLADEVVCTADGVWDTVGHFAKNATYVVCWYGFLDALLSYKHACMRGDVVASTGAWLTTPASPRSSSISTVPTRVLGSVAQPHAHCLSLVGAVPGRQDHVRGVARPDGRRLQR